jgi:hypothetical protein
VKPGAIPTLNLTPSEAIAEPDPGPAIQPEPIEVVRPPEKLVITTVPSVLDNNTYCRLCGLPQEDSEEFQLLNEEVVEKISGLLPGIKEHSSLALYCCPCCIDQLNEIICFQEQCEKVEQKLLEIQAQNQLYIEHAERVKQEEVVDDHTYPEYIEEEYIDYDNDLEEEPVEKAKILEQKIPRPRTVGPNGARSKFILEEVDAVKDLPPPYVCPYCPKTLKSIVGFKLHILFIHKNHSTKNYRKLKEMGLATPEQLAENNKYHACPVCSLCFKFKKDIEEHVNQHEFSDDESREKVNEYLNNLNDPKQQYYYDPSKPRSKRYEKKTCQII